MATSTTIGTNIKLRQEKQDYDISEMSGIVALENDNERTVSDPIQKCCELSRSGNW